LCGIIGASAGNDLYHPIQALLIGAAVTSIAYKLHYFVERRFKIDDAVGAVAVHGYGGFLGVVVAGFMLWGQPSSPYEGFAHINPLGNFAGACLMFLLGFVPIFIVSKILDSFGLLRVPKKVELEGLDFALNQTFMASVREVGAAEKAMIK
jgi:ammonia channel protein AmtB